MRLQACTLQCRATWTSGFRRLACLRVSHFLTMKTSERLMCRITGILARITKQTLMPLPCDCGMPNIDIGPCKSILFHADCISVSYTSLLSKKDSLQGYEAQCPAGLNLQNPSESEVLSKHKHLINDLVHLPMMEYSKVGSPVSKRKEIEHEFPQQNWEGKSNMLSVPQKGA